MLPVVALDVKQEIFAQGEALGLGVLEHLLFLEDLEVLLDLLSYLCNSWWKDYMYLDSEGSKTFV